MKFKAVFSDIDGTFLNSNHEISPRTVNIVRKLNQKGVKFILVSARMPSAIISLQKLLHINEPIICYSGALVLDSEKEDKTRKVIKIHI